MQDPSGQQSPPAGSQTLARGLRALDVLADTRTPMSIAELADHLGVHRSNAYRLLRTLEEHRFVVRDDAGLIRLGPRIASLARGVSPALQTSALPALTELANDLGMTAFVAVLDGAEVTTLVSVEPSRAGASLAQRPGSRHPLSQGAPGHAIEAELAEADRARLLGGTEFSPGAASTQRLGYALSQNEVVPGLTSVAVPLTLAGEPPAALAIVTIGTPDDLPRVAERLHEAVARITRQYH